MKEANRSGSDLAVSFHVNAGGGDGFEAYHYESSEKGKRLAGLCEKHVKKLGQNSRGLKKGDHLLFIKKTTMTAVLLESFFIDNKKDKTFGDTVTEQSKLGIAYAKAILEYLGVTYKTKSSNAAIYRVQVGAYTDRANAEAMNKRLKKAGFDSIIV